MTSPFDSTQGVLLRWLSEAEAQSATNLKPVVVAQLTF